MLLTVVPYLCHVVYVHRWPTLAHGDLSDPTTPLVPHRNLKDTGLYEFPFYIYIVKLKMALKHVTHAFSLFLLCLNAMRSITILSSSSGIIFPCAFDGV